MHDDEKKYVYLNGCYYELVDSTILNSDSISMCNMMTGEYARHKDGILVNEILQEDDLFRLDSSFIMKTCGEQVSFFCVNPGLENFCLFESEGVGRIVNVADITEEAYADGGMFDLLDKKQTFIRENVILGDAAVPKVVAFGSSATEIFDYIFGDNPNYLPFWASSWSARGLKKTELHLKPYSQFLDKISNESIILLHFGTVDADFNLPYKLSFGFYNIPRFVDEMVEGIIFLRNFLRDNYGFKHIYSVFTAPSIPLADEYWTHGDIRSIPAVLRAKVLWDCAEKLSSTDVAVINCLPELVQSKERPICAETFIRDYPDHHIDYVKVQDIVYDKLKEIPGMIPQKKIKHTFFYPHLQYLVTTALERNTPRPRTCR